MGSKENRSTGKAFFHAFVQVSLKTPEQTVGPASTEATMRLSVQAEERAEVLWIQVLPMECACNRKSVTKPSLVQIERDLRDMLGDADGLGGYFNPGLRFLARAFRGNECVVELCGEVAVTVIDEGDGHYHSEVDVHLSDSYVMSVLEFEASQHEVGHVTLNQIMEACGMRKRPETGNDSHT